MFTALYLIEMVLKFIAWGFVGIHIDPNHENKRRASEKERSVFSYMVNNVFNSNTELSDVSDSYKGYFYDGWNILDFIIVVVGSILPLSLGNKISSIGSIRALRILRALRTIPRVPSYVSLCTITK